MICQNCKKRNANVHLTEITNNKKVEMYLCSECAEKAGQINIIYPIDINEFFTGLLGSEPKSTQTATGQDPVCGKCGMSYGEFKKTGRLGCDECYSAFEKQLKPVLKRLHGDYRHTGRKPADIIRQNDTQSASTADEIEILKSQLDDSVKKEEYEVAAQIRDKIKELESQKEK